MNEWGIAWRRLRKNAGFTSVAVITLALGIGASTTVFSIVNGVLLQPLDYPESHRIVNVWEGDHKDGWTYGYHDQTSPANYFDWRSQNTTFETLGLFANHGGLITRSFIYTGGDEAHRLSGRFVSNNFFDVFGLKPIMGRTFLPSEEKRGAQRVVVISHRLWSQIFNQDNDIIGQTINLENNGRHTYEIIGVMPEGFRYPFSDLWVSIAHMPESEHRRGGDVMSVIGRLKKDTSIQEAQAEMNVIQWQIFDAYKGMELLGADRVIGPNIALEPMLDSVVKGFKSSLFIFTGAVGLLLLISVANVANLLLSRALTRQREMSLRAAVGAQRHHLIRQLLTESVLLALIGGIAGVLLSWWGTNLIIQFNAGAIPRASDIGVDWRVLAFTMLISVLTGILFGFAPAWQASRPNLNDALRQGANRLTGDKFNSFIRNAFSVTQIALALVLLIGAVLLIQSFNRMQSIDPGIDAEKLLTVEVTMNGAAYQDRGQRITFLERLIDEMKATPGVENVSAVSVLPSRKGWPYPYTRADKPRPLPNEQPRAGLRSVMPDHHETYGIGILRGRGFKKSDNWTSERVMMVNKAFADSAFKDEEVIGKYLQYYGKNWRIIGVFDNHKNNGLTREPDVEVNMPYAQWPGTDAISVHLTVRAESDPLILAPVVTEKVRKLNPDQPLSRFVVMQQYLDASIAIDRFRSMLITMFAVSALILASVGIYGVMSYSVEQRTNEMGIRLALGARRMDLLRMILLHGLKHTVLGVFVGLVGSYALTRVLANRLYNITATDPKTFLLVSVILIFVGMLACLVPAIRATRVSPLESLRYE